MSQATQKEANQALELLLEYGINHIDTAHMYGNAEQIIGSWMMKYRDDFFLATKTRKRTHKGAITDLHQSLRQLKIDYLDLWQMHSLTGMKGWEVAMGSNGVIETFIEAREKGLVHFLGVTGHGAKAPVMHQRSLARFNFDSVLLPLNYTLMQKTHYAADFNSLVEICRAHQVALQTIKSVARRSWKDQERRYHTYFYEPLDNQESIDLAVHWVLGYPDVFLITAGDMHILPMILSAASRYKQPPTDIEMSTMVDKYDMLPIFT